MYCDINGMRYNIWCITKLMRTYESNIAVAKRWWQVIKVN